MKPCLLIPFAFAFLALVGCSAPEPAPKAKTVTVTVNGYTPVVVVVGDATHVDVKRGGFDADGNRIYRPSNSDPTPSSGSPLVIPWCSWNDTPMPDSGQDTCDDTNADTASTTPRS